MQWGRTLCSRDNHQRTQSQTHTVSVCMFCRGDFACLGAGVLVVVVVVVFGFVLGSWSVLWVSLERDPHETLVIMNMLWYKVFVYEIFRNQTPWSNICIVQFRS